MQCKKIVNDGHALGNFMLCIEDFMDLASSEPKNEYVGRTAKTSAKSTQDNYTGYMLATNVFSSSISRYVDLHSLYIDCSHVCRVPFIHCLLCFEISVLFEQASQAVRGNFLIIGKKYAIRNMQKKKKKRKRFLH